MSEADIATALLEHLEDLEIGSPPLPIAMPEVAFTPPADGKYLEARLFWNRPRWEALGPGKQAQGLLQVTVIWPKGVGLIVPAEAVDQVLTHFTKGTVLQSGSATMKVSAEPWATSPLADASEVRIPITIPWTA